MASGQLQTQIPFPDAQEKVKVASATCSTGQRSGHENWKVTLALNKMCVSLRKDILFPESWKRWKFKMF